MKSNLLKHSRDKLNELIARIIEKINEDPGKAAIILTEWTHAKKEIAAPSKKKAA